MAGKLLERDVELALLRAALAGAQEGKGGLLAIEGPAGAGKSALLRVVREDARSLGFQVFRAVGGELERRFPYGIVRQLLEPTVRGLAGADRAELLTGAAAAAGPVLGIGENPESGGDSPFASLHGLYWLVATLTEDSPAVLLVDDAQWGDEPSLRFLDFLSRRIDELPLLLVVAARPAEPGAPQDLLNAITDATGDAVIGPAPLTREGVRSFLAEGLLQEPDDAVIQAAERATGGNPLLLRELVRTLATNRTELTVAAIAEAVPSSVVRSVSRRLSRVSPETRATAQALALTGRSQSVELLASVTGQQAGAVSEGLAALRALELVEDDPPRFVHPLVRSAVAETIPAGARTALHRRAAEHLRAHGRDQEELLVHLMATPIIAEPWAVDVLCAGARRASSEGAVEAAVQRWGRAVEEARALERDSAEIEFELGKAMLSAGDPEGMARLVTAAESSNDELAAEALRVMLGTVVDLEAGEVDHHVDQAEALSERLRSTGRELPTGRLQSQCYTALTRLAVLSDRRQALVGGFGPGHTPGEAIALAMEGACTTATRREIAGLSARVLSASPFATLESLEQPLAFYAMEAAISMDVWEGWPEAIATAQTTARRTGSRVASGFSAFLSANWTVNTGSMASAEARAREALDHFLPFGPTVCDPISATIVAALVRRGRLTEAESAVAATSADDALAGRYQGLFIYDCRAQLRLAQGRHREAVADLRALESLVSEFGWRRFCHGYGRQLLALALALTGEREEALQRAQDEVADAREREVPGAEVMALIALGHALAPRRGTEALEAAMRRAADATVWLQALAEYEFGSALRRANQRADARRHLARARELAHRVDATGLVQRATEELLVAGGRPRRERTSGLDALTPSERRVAEHAAAGLSNREIAEMLFVTRKTVELHLGNTFGKLGIRSRTQLSPILTGSERGESDPA